MVRPGGCTQQLWKWEDLCSKGEKRDLHEGMFALYLEFTFQVPKIGNRVDRAFSKVSPKAGEEVVLPCLHWGLFPLFFII